MPAAAGADAGDAGTFHVDTPALAFGDNDVGADVFGNKSGNGDGAGHGAAAREDLQSDANDAKDGLQRRNGELAHAKTRLCAGCAQAGGRGCYGGGMAKCVRVPARLRRDARRYLNPVKP